MSKFINKRALVAIIIIAFVIGVALSCITIVQPGHTGVVVTFGRVDDTVLQEGLHFKIPLVQNVVMIDNRITKLEVDTEAFSSDLQTVETRLAINYRVDTAKSYSIYKNIGSGYEGVLVEPAVNEVLKAIVAQYSAEESVTNRTLISNGLVDGLNNKLNDIGLYVTDVNIINFEFSEAYINAIEEKQVAQQKLLKAETEKQTAITNAQAEAEAIKIRAEAEAEALKITARAEAEANATIAESLTSDLIQYHKVDKWDGKLPTVTGGAAAILDVSDISDGDTVSEDAQSVPAQQTH